MIALNEHDYIQSYAQAVEQLNQSPDDRELQHQAVLSLARTGSLDFALSEYARYRLNKLRNHEDIMALGGRLSKDLYLRARRQASSVAALKFAQNSAHQYEAAFQETKGYYSGINAATMALMADMPQQIILSRIEAILDVLPPIEKLTPKDHYFIEATRAECLLLRGALDKAKDSLEAAIAFDPLNYTAHATTLKQFKMILDKKELSKGWLSQFSPPRTVHYAGHIALNLTQDEHDALAASVTDHLQRHDIGFGYGALAAGSDIIMAEALLQEGAELHVILPCQTELFLEHSVKPFGADWVPRFKSCLAAASSVKLLTESEIWPDANLNRLCAKIAMGQAVLRSQHFAVPAAQLLIWDKSDAVSYTAQHAKDWQMTGRDPIIIPFKNKTARSHAADHLSDDIEFLLQRSDQEGVETYPAAYDAARAALKLQAEIADIHIALHANMPATEVRSELAALSNHDIPRGIFISETLASLLAYADEQSFDISFAGLVRDANGASIRSYALTG